MERVKVVKERRKNYTERCNSKREGGRGREGKGGRGGREGGREGGRGGRRESARWLSW